MACSKALSGNCVWYSAIKAGDALRLSAYSTTSSFLLEVAPAHLHRELGADEAEIAAKLDQEGLEFFKQVALQVGFAVVFREAQEFEHVRILEDAAGAGLNLCQHCRHFWRLQNNALERCCSERSLEVTAGPLLPNRHAQVEPTLLRPFANGIVRLGQFSRQCRDNCVAPVSLGKLPHAEQVRTGEAAQPRLTQRNARLQLRDHAVAPFCSGDLAAD